MTAAVSDKQLDWQTEKVSTSNPVLKKRGCDSSMLPPHLQATKNHQSDQFGPNNLRKLDKLTINNYKWSLFDPLSQEDCPCSILTSLLIFFPKWNLVFYRSYFILKFVLLKWCRLPPVGIQAYQKATWIAQAKLLTLLSTSPPVSPSSVQVHGAAVDLVRWLSPGCQWNTPSLWSALNWGPVSISKWSSLYSHFHNPCAPLVSSVETAPPGGET